MRLPHVVAVALLLAVVVVVLPVAGCRYLTPQDLGPESPVGSSAPRPRISPSLEIPPPRD